MKALKFFVACVSILAITSTAVATTWPSTTLVTWDGIEDRVCYEQLVWCLLKSTTSYTEFSNLVGQRTDTIWRWHDNGFGTIRTAIVEIELLEDLATEATAYWNNSLIKYATPILLEVELFWPDDNHYINEQWYLHATNDNLPQGHPSRSHGADIDWHLVVDVEPPQRGNANVRIGIIDTGISMDEEGNLNHPDLTGNRFINAGNFVDDNDDIRDGRANGHGTGMASLVGGLPNNLGPEEEED